jgi:predicted metal-dependent hydrolase
MATRPEFVETADKARLIPVAASSNQEQRTLSVLLAALRGVQALQEVLLGALNQRVGKCAKVDAWTEVNLNDRSAEQEKTKAEERVVCPDRVLRSIKFASRR